MRTVKDYEGLLSGHLKRVEEKNGLYYPISVYRKQHPLGGFKTRMEALETMYVYLRENGKL